MTDIETRISALENRLAELEKLLKPAKQCNDSKYSESFDRWWSGYRRTPIMSKSDAFKAWQKALTITNEMTLFKGLAAYNLWLGKNPTHPVCHASSWLRQNRWEGLVFEDEPLKTIVVTRGTPEHTAWLDHYLAIGKHRDVNARFLDRLTVPTLYPDIQAAG